MTFYAVPNDLVGGWGIATRPGSMAAQWNDEGYLVVGDLMSEEWATRIADLLNRDDVYLADYGEGEGR